jgi:hypothetical protein
VFAAVNDQQQECRKHDHVAYPAHVIPDDWTEASGERDQTQSTAGDENNPPPPLPTINKEDEENLTDFFKDIQDPNIILDDDYERLTAASPQSELLRWHYRPVHTSFAKLKLISALVILPRILASVHPESVQDVYLVP